MVNQDDMQLINRLFICVVMLCMLVSTPALAADDAYLKMLNGEAEELELDQSGQLKQEEQKSTHIKQSDMWGGELQSDEIPKGLSPEEFESVLKQNFYGTYMFFNKLDSADKQTVFYRYSKAGTPDTEVIRQSIMDLLRR